MDALIEAAGKYIVATSCISVSLIYQVPRVGEAKRDMSSGPGETTRIAHNDQIPENIQLLEPTGYLCTSPPTGSVLPLSAVIRGGVGCTSERLTGEVAKRVVDWVWRDAMPHGRPLHLVNLHIAHYGERSLPERCSVCRLSMTVRLYYLPRDAPSLSA